MAKDSLTDAIFELKDRERHLDVAPAKRKKKPHNRRALQHPRAFDSFHTFSLMLLVLGIALQIIALALYA